MNGESTIMPSPAVLSVDPLSTDESAPEMLRYAVWLLMSVLQCKGSVCYLISVCLPGLVSRWTDSNLFLTK